MSTNDMKQLKTHQLQLLTLGIWQKYLPEENYLFLYDLEREQLLQLFGLLYATDEEERELVWQQIDQQLERSYQQLQMVGNKLMQLKMMLREHHDHQQELEALHLLDEF